MPFGLPGDVKRVGEARYAPRVREAALNEERADDKARLAELEGRVRRQKPRPSREDSVELHSPEPKSAPPKSAGDKPSPPADSKHLDITI